MPSFDAASAPPLISAKVSTQTWSHTCSGTDRGLAVWVFWRDAAVTVSSVTYGGAAMTAVGPALAGAGNTSRMQAFTLLAPPTGANDIVITLSADASVVAIAQSVTGADQTAAPVLSEATAQTTAPSVAVSSAADRLITDAVANFSNATATANASQTDAGVLSSSDVVLSACRMRGSRKAGAASTTMDWTLSSSQVWGLQALDWAPSAAPPAGSTVNVWTGTAWAAKPVKRWDGAAWVAATLKRWDGAAWVTE